MTNTENGARPGSLVLRRPAHLVARRLHRLDDVLVARAAAEVRREHIQQFLITDIGLPFERICREHQKARRAEAALESMVRDEGALERMQFLAVGEALHGADL